MSATRVRAKDIAGAAEAARLAAVGRYQILDTPPDRAFDRIAAIAARLFEVPMAAVTVVDADRVWFKAQYGPGQAQIGREPGLFASVIQQSGPYVVTDAQADPRTLDHPLVCGAPGIRFFAGAPITTADGYRLGSVDVFDTRAHGASPARVALLCDLAAVVMDELELRLSAMTTVRADIERRELSVRSESATRDLGYAVQRLLLPSSLPRVPGLDLASHYHAASPNRIGGDFYDLFPLGGRRWAFFLGDVEGHGPGAAAVTSLIRDTLRAAAIQSPDPVSVLAVLNSALLLGQQDLRFCTVTFGVITLGMDEVPGCRIVMASGGHPPALWLCPEAGEIRPVGPTGGMLCGVLADATFSRCELHLDPGQGLLLHTDGLTEARSGDQPMLGDDGLREFLQLRLGATSQQLVTEVAGLIGEMQPRDDCALLVIRAAPLDRVPVKHQQPMPGGER